MAVKTDTEERFVVCYADNLTDFEVGRPTDAGIYVFEPAVLGEFPGPVPKDIGFDLLPRLIGRAWGLPIEGYFRDVGTAEAY